MVSLVAGKRGKDAGIYHMAGDPPVNRYGWPREIVGEVPIEPTPRAKFPRPCRVPPRAVLDTSLVRSLGFPPGEWLPATRAIVRTLASLSPR